MAMLSRLTRRPRSATRAFLAKESAGGLLLIAAAVLAMIIANSPLGWAYFHALHLETGSVLSAKLGPMTPHLWINDGLMSLFFLLVGDSDTAARKDLVIPDECRPRSFLILKFHSGLT